MSSVALRNWRSTAQAALDEIEAAHEAVGGSGRGRRYATLQMNHAYAMLLSSQFQGFCRDLHTEAVDELAKAATPVGLQPVLYVVMMQGRKLDQGNPNAGNLGSDYSRLGMQFWTQVGAVDSRRDARQQALDELATWRNAIAHQDWSKVGNSPKLQIQQVRAWRRNCAALARAFDKAVGQHLAVLVGRAPW
jgi:hypothetical protein